MDALHTSSSGSELNQVLKSNACGPTNFRNSSHSVRLLEDLLILRKSEVLCDIRFKTDDGTIIFGHKNVLMAASPYFSAMFSNFDESNKDLVNIRELDSTILRQLVDYIYTGEIMITKENVQVLLPTANLLQLNYVSGACAEFLQTQLDPSNCIGIKEFADLHNCMELVLSSEAYIKKRFLEVAECDEFLSLSFQKLLELISCNDLSVSFEEKVFECVINWVKHELICRKDFLEKLMEHVRLPLASTQYILQKVIKEPLLKHSPKCKDYVFEALHFNLLKSVQRFTIPLSIRCRPRQFDNSQKVILMFSQSDTLPNCYTQWYDPSINLRENAPGINHSCVTAGVGVIKDQFVFVVGGMNRSSSRSVSMLDVSLQLPCWVPMVDMLVSRHRLGVGVLDDCLYAVGGHDDTSALNSVEVFDVGIQKWRMVTSMTIARSHLGVCVLNNRLYAVGGNNDSSTLKSVECYDPSLDTWTQVADMSVCRSGFGIGILDGVIYVIGGYTESEFLNSVQAFSPSDGVWSTIADMEACRYNPVISLDGLLYVMGGDTDSYAVDSVEIYDPNTNTWSKRETLLTDQIYNGVVVHRPPHFRTN
ncbi:ring canal kelch homolog isoform X2 [Acyrthosiphon pisum]|uniref:Kelch-like protein diablo n=1 Tax=Acyrthosiphon pisum TaxID=7029 RepID=A0A8R2H8X9_ACYPI|nr:ring canal kelch homolog isoform X2 [Acyrthosiphon pisum]|eukprot:XP_016659557.1 PREDICTED: ring canal kelch homolog isoform X2 [Acyrthosiphon pisum]